MAQEALQEAARAVLDAARFVPLYGISSEHTRLADAINALADALIDPTPRRRKPSRYELELEIERGLAQLREPMPPTTPDDDDLPF
jgi:hypothetical protein